VRAENQILQYWWWRPPRLARRSAKLSRYCPPAYIKATTTPARYSAKTRAASIESAATISKPTSPRRKLIMISARRAIRTGIVAVAHIGPMHPSGKLRHEADNKATRRQRDNDRSKMFSKTCYRPDSLHRRWWFGSIQHALTAPE